MHPQKIPPKPRHAPFNQARRNYDSSAMLWLNRPIKIPPKTVVAPSRPHTGQFNGSKQATCRSLPVPTRPKVSLYEPRHMKCIRTAANTSHGSRSRRFGSDPRDRAGPCQLGSPCGPPGPGRAGGAVAVDPQSGTARLNKYALRYITRLTRLRVAMSPAQQVCVEPGSTNVRIAISSDSQVGTQARPGALLREKSRLRCLQLGRLCLNTRWHC